MMRVGASITGLYVDWTLFLSGYCPLLAIFAFRLQGRQCDLAFWLYVAAAVVALNLGFVLSEAVAPRTFILRSIHTGTSELSAYVATYLLPFLVVSDVGWRDLTSYLMLVVLVGIVMTHGEALHVNPLLGALGFRLYTVTTDGGGTFYALALRRLKVDDRVVAREVRARLLLIW